MRLMGPKASRGDTIIEVILSVTVFSLVAVGAMTIMNNGIAMAQRTLETTQVRYQIDAQAEMLRYVRDNASDDPGYGAMWDSMTRSGGVNARLKGGAPVSILDRDRCPDSSAIGNPFFTLSPSTAGRIGFSGGPYREMPATYAKVDSGTSEGVSIQMVRAEGAGAYDAYIQACWYGPGSSRPATIGTIVRLYDPR